MTTVSPTTTALNLPASATDREKLSATAKQFEAIFMRQVLAASRKADFGGEKLLGGQALDTFRQMQDDHFADVTAQSGTLGFAAKIEAQLARFLPPSPAAPPAALKTPAAPKASAATKIGVQ